MLSTHSVVLREQQEASICWNSEFGTRTKTIFVASSMGCRRAEVAEQWQTPCPEGKQELTASGMVPIPQAGGGHLPAATAWKACVMFGFCEIPRPPLWVKRTSLLRDLDTLLAGGSVCPNLIFLNKAVKLLNAVMEYFLWGELLNPWKDWHQGLESALSSRIYSKLYFGVIPL